MGPADFYSFGDGSVGSTADALAKKAAANAAANAPRLALPPPTMGPMAPVAEAPGFLARALPTLRNVMGGVTALGAGTGVALTNATENMVNGGGYYNNTIADSYAKPLAEEYAANGVTPKLVGQGIRAVGHTALGGLADAILPSANSGVGSFLTGLTGIDPSKMTTTKPSLAAPRQQTVEEANIDKLKKDAATDKRPVIYHDELPKFTMGQLKMLAPFLNKSPTATENMKGGYLNTIAAMHDAELKEAAGDSKKIQAANKNYMRRYLPIVSGSAAPGVQMGMGEEDF